MAGNAWPGRDEVYGSDYLMLQHRCLKLALGGNYVAPLQDLRTILDVGCGQGLWAQEMAQEFPTAEVTGFDIDRRFFDEALARLPAEEQFPANFHFLEADALQRFPFDSAAFDYIHLRLVSGAIPPDSWRNLLGEMVRVLRPGGWVEVVDVLDMPHSQSPAFMALIDASKRLMRELNKPIGIVSELSTLMQHAGLTAIHEQQIMIGASQGRTQHELLQATALVTLQATEPLIEHLGILSVDQFRTTLERARAEIAGGSSLTWPLIAAYGMCE